MVSIEEEMIQKDKETAVLKANHKHQILLNIELERIERCRRAYEGFHNFEVALIKARREKIVLKQVELKRKTGAHDMMGDPRGYVVMAEGERRCVEKALRTDLSNPRAQTLKESVPEGTRGRALFQPGDRQNKVKLKTKDQIVGTKTTTCCPNTVNGRRQATSNPKYSDATQSGYKRKEFRAEQDLVRFPIVTSSHSPNVFTTQTLQIHPPDSHNTSATPARNSWKLHTARNSGNTSKKKSVRSAVKDVSPFDRYRLRLQESEERTRKCKLPFRSISAVDTLLRKGGGNDKIPTSYRRVRSADFQ